MLNIKEFIDGVHEYLQKQFDPVLKRLEKMEKLAPIPGPQGEPGLDGKDGAAGERGEKGEPGLDGKDGAAGERGEKGEPGLDGKDGVAGERGEKGEPGLDGKDGAAGERGEKGEPGLDGKDGAAGERGEKGEPGLDGKDGAAGERGEKGEPGLDGKDGAAGERGEKGEPGLDGKAVTQEDIKSVVDNQLAVYALEFERRATDVLQKAIAALPTPKNGVDGIGFDDLEVVQLSEKQLQIIFKQGDRVREFTIDMPIVIDRGVYGSGKGYMKGDGVTYGGSFWIAQVNKPGQGPGKGAEWRLAVKKGKDA